jgi:hypothetical protein
VSHPQLSCGPKYEEAYHRGDGYLPSLDAMIWWERHETATALACYESTIQAALRSQASTEFRQLLRQAGLDTPVPFSMCRLTARCGRNYKGSPVTPAEDGEEVEI